MVGVTTAASAGGPGASYAVPIEDALSVVDSIQDGEETGSVQIGPDPYLGISVQGAGPVVVTDVEAGSAAAEAGVDPGSVITALNGEPVGDFADLEQALGELEPGDRVTLAWTGARGGESEASVTLDESPVN